jgi:hypothetical protein
MLRRQLDLGNGSVLFARVSRWAGPHRERLAGGRRYLGGPQVRRMETRDRVMGARLKSHRDLSSIRSHQAKLAVLAAIGEEALPRRRRPEDEVGSGDVFDPSP